MKYSVHDMQIVKVELDPAGTVTAEPGAMNYMEDGIDCNVEPTDNLKLMIFLGRGRKNCP